MNLLHQATGLSAEQPQTHALVIGVGKYAHLDNVRALRLGQLTSPIASARAFAQWLIEKMDNPAAPLASVDLLLSSQVATENSYPLANGELFPLRAATFDNIADSFEHWYGRCNKPGNVAIFYFCGHGLEKEILTLLPQDFGRRAGNPWSTAINFDETVAAMKSACHASVQCYFIDTCRHVDSQTLETSTFGGVALLQTDLTAADTKGSQLILRATAVGRSAYGQANAPSRFTATLVRALDSGGAAKQDNHWVITLSSLANGVNGLMALQNQAADSSQMSDPRLEGPNLQSVIHHVRQMPAWSAEPMTQATNTTDLLQSLQQRLHQLTASTTLSPTPIHPHLLTEIGEIAVKTQKLEQALAASGRFETKLTIHYTLPNQQKATFVAQGLSVIIGRRKTTPIDLELAADPKVSRPHARLYYNLGAWWVEHINSRNKTILNGKVITEATSLSPNDTLLLGDTLLTVEFARNKAAPLLNDFESQATVNEFEPSPSISEDSRIALLAQIKSLVTSTADPRFLLERFLQMLRTAFPQAAHHSILLIDRDQELIPPVASPAEPAQVSYTLARRAIRSRQALHWVRALVANQEHIASLSEDILEALCTPMLLNGQPIGVLYVDATQPTEVFSEHDRNLLSEMATIMAFSLQGIDSQTFAALPSVFISYAPTEQALVKRLAGDLRRRRIKVWFDERLRVGDDREAEIHKAIAATDGFVLLLSPASVTSTVVLGELEAARSSGKTIYPLLTKTCQLPASIETLVPLEMAPDRYTEGLTELAEVIYARRAGRDGVQSGSRPLASERSPARPPLQPAQGIQLPSGRIQRDPTAILLLAANPADTPRLRLLEEVDAIKNYLRQGTYANRFEVIQELTVNLGAFFGHLQRYKPQILHFSGHGARSGGIHLANDKGESRIVEADVLRDLFAILKEHVRCVVLNACFSATQAQALAQEIDCVVGMAGDISDDAAIRFASDFYQALSNGQSVANAVKYGELALRAAKLQATPQLLVKPGVDAAEITFI